MLKTSLILREWSSLFGVPFVRHVSSRASAPNKRFTNPNKSSPLTTLPDYTFMDGRVTPFGSNQRKRMLQQRALATQIVTLTKEMDFALDRYNQMRADEETARQEALKNQLKPKGHLLLKK